jgi:hypothetical protein
MLVRIYNPGLFLWGFVIPVRGLQILYLLSPDYKSGLTSEQIMALKMT